MSRIAFVLALLLPLAASGAELSVQKADEQHGFLRATATAQAQQPMDGDEIEEDAWDDKAEAQLSANPDDNADLIEARDRAEEKAANGAFVSGQDGPDSGLALNVKADDSADSESFDEDSAGDSEPSDVELGIEQEEETPAAEEDDVDEKELEPVSLIELGMQKKSEDEDDLEEMVNDEVEDEDFEHAQLSSEDEEVEQVQDDDEVPMAETEMDGSEDSPAMDEQDEAEEEGSTVALAGKDALSEDLEDEEGEQQDSEDPIAGEAPEAAEPTEEA